MVRLRNHPEGKMKPFFQKLFVVGMLGLGLLLPYESRADCPLTTWGSSGSPPFNGVFSHARGVAVDGSGNVYVVDQMNNRIQKFAPDSTFLTTWGSQGTGDGQFNLPQNVAVDDSGNVYVADTSNHRIQKFAGDGTFLTKWGSQGSGDGQFIRPEGVAVDGTGNVYVADPGSGRIQKFAPDSTFQTAWPAPLGALVLVGIAVDGSGDVYITDQNNNLIDKFTSDGTLLMASPSMPVATSTLLVLGRNASRSSPRISPC